MTTTARDIMIQGVECVRSGDTVEVVARRMAELGVGALPICGADGAVKGMLTDRDIVVKVVAQRKDASGVVAGELEQGTPVFVRAGDDVAYVCDTMAQHQIRRIPVLDGGRLVGIISQADVARALDNTAAGQVVASVSQA